MAGAKVDLSPQKLAKRVYTYIHAALQKAVFFYSVAKSLLTS